MVDLAAPVFCKSLSNQKLLSTIMRSKGAQALPYAQRAEKYTNPAARELLLTMERKKSNLSVSVDVTKSRDFLAIIDAVGPYVCLIKVK